MAEEIDLAKRAAAGDSAAFSQLVRMHEARIRRFLERLVRGDGADDLAQLVFLTAWRMRGAWRGEGSYAGWLMRIAWTSFLADQRARGRRQMRDQHAYESTQIASTGAVDAEAAIDLDRALAALDVRERAAAQLCLGEGYSHGEAARIMELPLGTLKTVVARARSQLAQALEAGR
jgi:RNA polymerase sigma factor (sigma-70 family)